MVIRQVTILLLLWCQRFHWNLLSLWIAVIRVNTYRTNKMAIASGNMVFYYMARDNLCFLTLCEDAYPKRLAFLYLEDIADITLNELQREYGINVSFYLQCDRRGWDDSMYICICLYIYIIYIFIHDTTEYVLQEMRIPILSMNFFVMIQKINLHIC